MKNIEIGLWRNVPPICSLKKEDEIYPIEQIFPSGRQALKYALSQVGLSRSNRIALPEWSSHCVISSVGELATPIPMNEVIKFNINVKAVLIYEQWGWPIPRSIRTELLEKFKDTIIILDRVDSADLDNENRIKFYPEVDQIDIISLSKILGLIGGGLAKLNGDYLSFTPNIEDQKLSKIFWNKQIFYPYFSKLLNIHKNEIESLHPELNQWLLNNDLIKALQIENLKRRKNLSMILESDLNSNWPEWMFNAFKDGAGPGVIPLFRNHTLKVHTKIQHFLLKSFSLETSIYHFNYSGNPLNSSYEFVLAFPIHGMLEDKIIGIIESLTKFIKSFNRKI